MKRDENDRKLVKMQRDVVRHLEAADAEKRVALERLKSQVTHRWQDSMAAHVAHAFQSFPCPTATTDPERLDVGLLVLCRLVAGSCLAAGRDLDAARSLLVKAWDLEVANGKAISRKKRELRREREEEFRARGVPESELPALLDRLFGEAPKAEPDAEPDADPGAEVGGKLTAELRDAVRATAPGAGPRIITP